MNFGSVCSGIEAASVAWEPLGWRAAWFAEIEPFPSAVLAHHYPEVHNWGDMTALPERIRAGEVSTPDILCGGTPCQAFSVAGKRQSLADARGNLSLTFCDIADAIDDARSVCGLPAAIVFWENVPGVLSTRDNAFGCFLAQLCGGSVQLDAPNGWPDAGCVSGPKRTAAWRVLDAQYFGLAQRRRRVFVVASARADVDPAAVLFEFDGVRRDTAPSREAGKVAPTIPSRSLGGGGLGTDFDCDGGLIQHGPEIARCIATREGSSQDWETTTMVAHCLRGEGFDASEDGTGRGTPLAPVAFHPTQDPISSTEVCRSIGANDNATAAVAFAQNQRDEVRLMDMAGALAAEPGMKQQTYLHQAMQVRRLTPVECERLQGFPDGYTAIPWRKKPANECPDSPRYKALGNSWAVPVVRWIGERINRAVYDRRTP